MTTPAVNVDKILWTPPSGTSRQTLTFADGHSTTSERHDFSSWLYTRQRKQRPKSNTSKWEPRGTIRWRQPLGWNGTYWDGEAGAGSMSASASIPTGSTRSISVSASGFNPTGALQTEPRWGTMSSGLLSRAEANALNRLKDQDVNVGEFIGTFRETVNLVAGNAHKIRRSFLRFRNSRKGRKALKHLASQLASSCPKCNWYNPYLEMTYGWTPLMLDVWGAIEHLQKASKTNGLVVHAQGRAFDKQLESNEIHLPAVAYGVGVLGYEGTVRKLSARCDLWFSLRSPGLAELSSLGLVNPVEIVWEIVRFSFVVDWFLPIGPWLSSLTGDVGWDFISGTHTEVIDVEQRPLSWSIIPGSVGYNGVANFPYVKKGFKFGRTVYDKAPVPGFYLKNPLSATHAVNAIALLAAAFGR